MIKNIFSAAKSIFHKKNNPNINSQKSHSRIKESNYSLYSSNYLSLSREGYMSNVIAYRAINMIAKSASSVKLLVYEKNSKGLTEIDDGILRKMIDRPNQSTNRSQFIETIVSHQVIYGNAYVCIAKDNLIPELQILRPDRVKIVNDGNYYIYKYTIDGQSYNFSHPENGLSDILHIKNFNPINDHYGMSGLSVATNSIDQHNKAINWNKSLLSNGARPSGAIVNGSSSQLTDDQFNRLKEQINDDISGAENTGKIMILDGGLEWKEMSINPKDMDFIETKNSAARDIALSIGVPPQLIGIKGDNTYNNMAEARLSFWEETVLPTLNNLCEQMSIWISDHMSRDLVITYDQDSISALSTKRQLLWENLKTTDFLTENEKREMLGFNQIGKKTIKNK